MLKVQELCKSYKNENVVCDVNFSVSEGEIVGYVGPNGAGKTSTLKMICNIVKADKGQIILAEGKKLGVIFDDNGLYPNMTAYENILFFVKLYNEKISNEEICNILKFVGLYVKKDIVVKNFSKGMTRKVVIARMLVCDPDILIMDEPFDGLDIESHDSIIKFLGDWVRVNNKSIIITSHNLKELQDFCTRIIFLKNGRVVLDGKISEIINDHFKLLRVRLYEAKEIGQVVGLLSTKNINFSVDEDNIYLYIRQNQCRSIIDYLLKHDIAVREIVEEKKNLEEIYLDEVVNGE